MILSYRSSVYIMVIIYPILQHTFFITIFQTELWHNRIMLIEKTLSPQRTLTAFNKRFKEHSLNELLDTDKIHTYYTFPNYERIVKWEFVNGTSGNWYGIKILASYDTKEFKGFVYEDCKDGVYRKGFINSLKPKKFDRIRSQLYKLFDIQNDMQITFYDDLRKVLYDL